MEYKTTHVDLVPYHLSCLRSSSSQRVTVQWVVSWHLRSGPLVPSASTGLSRKTTLDPKQHQSRGNNIKLYDVWWCMYITCTVWVCMYTLNTPTPGIRNPGQQQTNEPNFAQGARQNPKQWRFQGVSWRVWVHAAWIKTIPFRRIMLLPLNWQLLASNNHLLVVEICWIFFWFKERFVVCLRNALWPSRFLGWFLGLQSWLSVQSITSHQPLRGNCWWWCLEIRDPQPP